MNTYTPSGDVIVKDVLRPNEKVPNSPFICVCIYIYIYIYRERERERENDKSLCPKYDTEY